MPADKTIKVTIRLRDWLNAISDGTDETFSEIIESCVRLKYPNIEEIQAEANRMSKSRKGSIAKRLGNGDAE